jgi:hypothetical protein
MFIFKVSVYLLLILLFTACSTSNPFKQVALHSVVDINPIQIKQDFAKKKPDKLQIVNSVIFDSYWGSFYSLGYFKRDLTRNCFTLVALNPGGVRLFQITDNDGDVKYSCSIEELKKLGAFVTYIAGDIKNIYFDNIPSDNAIIKKKGDKIVFIELLENAKIEYSFGGKNNYLLGKILLRKRNWFWRFILDDYYRVWSVGYYGYKANKGKVYPRNIYYENNVLNYRLIIRLKEIM